MSDSPMSIGIGLPANIPGVEGEHLIEWAQRADTGPFSSLGLIDRLVYANYDTLIALTAAAAVTKRVRLVTTILLAPLHSAAQLAKQTASLDALSGGRLTLGLGVGAREDDYQAAGASFHERGKVFDQQLATMQRLWSGEPLSESVGPIGPTPVQIGGPEILIGAISPTAMQRLGKWGHGFISAAGGLQLAQQGFNRAKDIWNAAGRAGKPRLVACAYYALGPDALPRAEKTIHHYYAPQYYGPQWGPNITQSLPLTPEAIRALRHAFAEIGADELIFIPCLPEFEQMDRLADALA